MRKYHCLEDLLAARSQMAMSLAFLIIFKAKTSRLSNGSSKDRLN